MNKMSIADSVCVCVCAQSLTHVELFATLWTVAHHAALPMAFSRQEYWSMLPFHPPGNLPNPCLLLGK